MKRICIIGLLSFLGFGSFSESIVAAEETSHIAIIVNKNNEVTNLTFKELVRYLKLDKQHWKSGKKINLVMQRSGTHEKNALLSKIYEMDNTKLKKFWLGKMFRGEITSFPKTFGSNESVKQFVSQGPSAIGFISASSQDDWVKAIQIDGYSPGDANYPLIVQLASE